MEKQAAVERLKELRERVDQLDAELVRRLNDRAKIVIDIRHAKLEAGLPLYDPGREEEIFEHITRANEGPLYDDSLRQIFECILHYMKSGDLGD
ncbi:MAG: chorismate mutase [Candidatus Aquicultorales bacterium]